MTDEEREERIQFLKDQLKVIRARKEKEAKEPMTSSDFLRGVGEGASAGFADEMTGALGAAIDPQDLGGMVEEGQQTAEALAKEAAAQDPQQVVQQMQAMGFSQEEIDQQLADLREYSQAEAPDLYDVYRDRARRLSQEAAERSPVATTMGQLTGAIGTGLASGATKLPALAAEGAAYGFGEAEGEVQDQLMQAGMGALTGAGMGAAGKKVGELGEQFADYLKGKANVQAVKAMKPTKKQLKDIYDEQRMGARLLEEDMVGPFRSEEKMLDKALKVEGELVKDLDTAYEDLGGQGISKMKVASDLMKRADDLSDKVANKKVVKEIREFAKDIARKDEALLSPSKIREERMELDDTINFQTEARTKKAAKNIRDVLRLTEEAEFSKAGLGEDFKKLKKRFGDVRDARRIIADSAARDKAGSMKELIKNISILGGSGVAGAAGMDPTLAAILGIGAAGGRAFGSGGMAKALDRMSRVRAPKAKIPARVLTPAILSQDPYGD